jgi:uroporphyrinogen-III synthase
MKTLLYTGLELPSHCNTPIAALLEGKNVVHFPLIKILPRPLEDAGVQRTLQLLPDATHLIFTSKQAVKIFLGLPFPVERLCSKRFGAVGRMTAAYLQAHGMPVHFVAQEETQEGLIVQMQAENLRHASILWPRSSLSRPVLTAWLDREQVTYYAPAVYDTVAQVPAALPDLAKVDEILFTSPSTVDAFLSAYHSLPHDKLLHAIGPVTRDSLAACCPDKAIKNLTFI